MTSRLTHWRRHSAQVAEIKVLANHDDVTGTEYETRHPALMQPSPVSSGPRGRLVHSNQVPLGLEVSHLELGGVGHVACFCPEDGSLENRPKTKTWILRPNGAGVPARGERMRYRQGNKSQGRWAAAMPLVLPPLVTSCSEGAGTEPDVTETWLRNLALRHCLGYAGQSTSHFWVSVSSFCKWEYCRSSLSRSNWYRGKKLESI